MADYTNQMLASLGSPQQTSAASANVAPGGNVLGTSDFIGPVGPPPGWQPASGPGGAYPIAGGVPTNVNTNLQPTNESLPDTQTSNVPSGPSVADLLNQQYESLYSQLNAQEGNVKDQQKVQNEVVANTYQNAKGNLDRTYGSSQKNIQGQQTKSLNDLANSIQQQWQQGNVMLGTRGASDSSAAKQYAYALTKLGTQEQGKLMGEYAGRLASLEETYNTNINNLETERKNNLLQIANWVSQALTQIGGQRAELQAQKSQQLADMAQKAISQVQDVALANKQVIDTWAANTASSLPQLQQVLASTSQNIPAFQSLYGDSGMGGYGGVSGNSLFGFSQETGAEDQNKGLFSK